MIRAEEAESNRGSQPPAGSPTAAAQLASPPDGSRREWRLRAVEGSVPHMRRELSAFLDDTGLSDDAFYDLVLAVSEAATNAVEHAQHPTEPFFDVFAEIDDGQVTIVVQDHGRWLPQTPSLHRGRGLAMMRVLADTTVAAGSHGTTVTMRNHSAVTAAPDSEEEEGRAS
jgi:anti-sigma regulatory factor (Ser/Thr protein kinase)